MKIILSIMIMLFCTLQYELWFSDGGILSVLKLRALIQQQQASNDKLLVQNHLLINNVKQLRHDRQAIEGEARSELGMIKKDETFYQVVN